MTWMRQKPRPDSLEPEPRPPAPTAAVPPAPTATPPPPVVPRREAVDVAPVAMIGKSVLVKGEIVGSEDLVIEGKVEGRIDLAGQHLRVGSGGEVRADLRAKHVVVEGEVFGDIRAEDRVEVAATGSVRGDIRAPRVSLAHGARFKGSIDMEGEAPRSQAVPPRAHSGAA